MDTDSRNWNLSGLILEGISGTGKSAIFKALLQNNKFLNRTYSSAIILSEHQTQRILEKKSREGALKKKDHLDLLLDHLSYLESLNAKLVAMEWCEQKMTDMRVPFILERFHLSHVYQYDHLQWSDVENIDSRLARLNGHLCLLTSDRHTLSQRLFEKNEKSWHNYLRHFGRTNDEITDHFYRQQEELISLSANSKLKKEIIDTSDQKIDAVVKRILKFWDLS